MDKKVGVESIFTVRGSLDGELEKEYKEKDQFIGLKIGSEEFLLPIETVHEIVMLLPITYVPHSKTYIEGVFNLRGTILPAINLRKMMGVERGELTPSVRIVIAKNNDLSVGLIVDAITYVISLDSSDVESQSLLKNSGAHLISQICKKGDDVVGVLDISKLIAVASE